jgi:outer membrane protein OmpA-like peptidoglycan-associated protein
MHVVSPVIRRHLRLIAVFALFAVHLPSKSQAQVVEPDYYGFGGGLNINQYSLDKQVYRGSELCGTFTEGSGLRPEFHFLYETKPSGWPLWLSPRLIFNNLGGDLTTAATDTGRIRDPIDSSLISSQREHRISASIPAIGLELFGKYKFGSTFFAFGGPTVSVLLSPSGEQLEVITAPSTGFFDETGTNTRTTNANALADASAIHAAFGIGVGADIPIARKWSVTPEISAHIPLTSIVSDDSWKVTQFRFALTIKMDNTQTHEEPPVLAVADKITGSVQLLGLERLADGSLREFETPSVRVEEFVSREAFPVLNSVFFEANSNAIPVRYSASSTLDTNAFRGGDALGAHHKMLEIVGSRLRNSPQTNITLRGIQTSTEGTMATLAEQRANSVADYLTSKWGIDRSRIAIESEKRISPTDPQLWEELQRVDIMSSDLALFDPFIVQDVSRTMNPPGLRVRSILSANAPLVQNNVTIDQKGGFGVNLGEQREVMDWFAEDENQFPKTEMPLLATLSASTGKASFEAHDTTQVQQLTIRKKRAERIADLEIERYNLITFEFDKATLDARAERIMKMIASEATSKDTIAVVGYTDLLGDEAHNAKLAADRATSVETALRNELRTAAPGAQIASRGEGERDLYRNSLPEGRQLSRTVRITIKRPIGE